MNEQSPTALRAMYDRVFFAQQFEGSSRSASVMVPHILTLLPGIASVVDLGCGSGVWLQQFKNAGIPRVLGLDGGNAEDGFMLLRHEEFRRVDFAEPLRVTERFDLALSIEVAEHLPPSVATRFVASLCQLSDAVVFGAAIPGQSGTWHINERWPSYWAALFDAEGYDVFDVIRPLAWYDHRVEWWYAQNTMLFVRRGRDDLAQNARAAAMHQDVAAPLDRVHPRCFEAFRRSLETHERALEDLRTQVAVATTRASEAEVRAGQAQARTAAAEALAMEADARTAAADARTAAAEARISAATADLTAILHSTSWRITGPLRRRVTRSPRLRRAVRSVLGPVWRVARAAVHGTRHDARP
jgi:SAM-dependent methyltransferase